MRNEGSTAPDAVPFGERAQVIFNRAALVLDLLRRGPLRNVDPKLFNSLVTLVVTHVVVDVLGADTGDPLWSLVIPGIVGAVVGWFTENGATAAIEGDPGEPDRAVPDEDLSSIPLVDTADLVALLPAEERVRRP